MAQYDVSKIEFAVLNELKAGGAKTVLDMGCGEGHLLRLLMKEKNFTAIAGTDVSDDESDQSATDAAFDSLYYIADKRLNRGRLTVIDATNVQPFARKKIIETARSHNVFTAAIVFDMPEELCIERNLARSDRNVGSHVVKKHVRDLSRSLRSLQKEGFRYVHIILLNLCCALVSKNEEKIETDDISRIIGHHEFRNFIRSFKNKEHELFIKDLVKFDSQKGFLDTEYCLLSQKAKDEFLADVTLIEKDKCKNKHLIPVGKLSEKKLYYNEKTRNRIDELTTLLLEDNLLNVQKRLSENGMRTGFACIFSGPPGTGKTESVYQIALKTGRDIMLVDISETKSCWFGESEKLIKDVFNKYRDMVESGGMIPILLFNEADAVLGKRREISSSSGGVDQTENAIQNIILQEMEDLKGILIATTNMTANFDKAFERRFLYKIEFDKPDFEAKKSIWKSNITDLSDEDAAKLAEQFDFSGGQIENIARKAVVSLILKGFTPCLSELEAFCKEELIVKHNIKIGF